MDICQIFKGAFIKSKKGLGLIQMIQMILFLMQNIIQE